MDTRKLVTMGMLSAIGVVLAALFEIPLVPAAPFLLYDPADIPILIGTLVYGPGAGLMMTVVVSVIQTLLHGSGGVIGLVMHVAATGSMSLVVGFLYRRMNNTLPAAAGALAAGAVTMTVVMVGMNLIFMPIFMGADIETVIAMLLPAIVPFNLFKAAINCGITGLLFRPIERIALRNA